MTLPAWLITEADGTLTPHTASPLRRFRSVIVVECEPVATMGGSRRADEAVRAAGAALMGRWLGDAVSSASTTAGLPGLRLAIIVVHNDPDRLTFAVTGLPNSDVDVDAAAIITEVLRMASRDVIDPELPPLAPQQIHSIYG